MPLAVDTSTPNGSVARQVSRSRANTRAARARRPGWSARRHHEAGGSPEFDFIGPDEQLATGPAEVLRLPESER